MAEAVKLKVTFIKTHYEGHTGRIYLGNVILAKWTYKATTSKYIMKLYSSEFTGGCKTVAVKEYKEFEDVIRKYSELGYKFNPYKK